MNVEDWTARVEKECARIRAQELSHDERQRAIDSVYLLLRAAIIGRELIGDEPELDFFVPNPNEDVVGCRALLLELIRRTTYDWVLCRDKTGPDAEIGREAFTWLFEEGPGHPWWELRAAEKRTLTSLLGICEVLDIRAEDARAWSRTVTVDMIIAAGRPPTMRHGRRHDDTYEEHLRGQVALGRWSNHVSAAPSHWEEMGGS